MASIPIFFRKKICRMKMQKIKLEKYIKEFLKYFGLMCCLIMIETVFRLQPEIMTNYISPLDEVPVLYDLLWSMILVAVLQMIPIKRIRGIVYVCLYVFLCVFMFSEYIYCRIFGRIYGVKTLQYAGEANDFAGMISSYFDGASWCIVGIYVLLGVVGWFLTVKIKKDAKRWKQSIVFGGIIIVISIGCILTIPKLFKETERTAQGPITYMYKRTIYQEWIDNKRAVGMFGAYEFLARDIRLSIQKEVVSEEDLAVLDTYFSENQNKPNEMTGVLEGKNLILVLMESIDDWLVNEETMPTMCKMMEGGINFTNMYTPIYGGAATLNSEFCSYTGLTAPANGVPLVNYTNNYYPYSLPHLFREEGYSAASFHYNSSSFYNRQNIHNVVGFEEYVSYQDYEEDEIAQQDSTLVTNDAIYQKLIENKPFFNLVITYSAHSSSGNKAYSHEDQAIEIYPEYIGKYKSEEMDSISAKARLTDDMFSELLVRLEEDNLLQDTVIIAYGDHYDYTISNQEYLKELSNAENVYELSKTPFFIWAEGLKSQEITKVVNITDVYPTICQLFSLDNAGYFIGSDLFDPDYEGYAYWHDGSWICEDGAFYSDTGERKGSIDAKESGQLQEVISEKMRVNQLVLETDYFRYLEKGIEK